MLLSIVLELSLVYHILFNQTVVHQPRTLYRPIIKIARILGSIIEGVASSPVHLHILVKTTDVVAPIIELLLPEHQTVLHKTTFYLPTAISQHHLHSTVHLTLLEVSLVVIIILLVKRAFSVEQIVLPHPFVLQKHLLLRSVLHFPFPTSSLVFQIPLVHISVLVLDLPSPHLFVFELSHELIYLSLAFNEPHYTISFLLPILEPPLVDHSLQQILHPPLLIFVLASLKPSHILKYDLSLLLVPVPRQSPLPLVNPLLKTPLILH